MKKKLNRNVIYPEALKQVFDNMYYNHIPIDSSCQLRIKKFVVGTFPKDKFKKNKIDITFGGGVIAFGGSFYDLLGEERKTTCKIVVTFTGKGGLSYKIVASCQIRAWVEEDQKDLLKAYTYVILQHMLTNDIDLRGIYPDDLIYPSVQKITGIDIETQNEKMEAKGLKSKVSYVLGNQSKMIIPVINDERKTDLKPFTEEDDEKYREMVEDYNKSQRDKSSE